MLTSILFILVSFAIGAAAGAFLAFYMGRPVRAGKAAPLMKRLIPSCIALLLLLILLFLKDLFPGQTRLFLLAFLPAFAVTLAGTSLGLEKRDLKMMELAFVFRIPDLSRIRCIDLPACRPVLILSICISGAASLLLGLLNI